MWTRDQNFLRTWDGRIGRIGQIGALRGRGRGFGYTVTEVIEVSDLDLALGKPLRSSGHRLLANAGCLCNDLLHPPCVQKVHGHGACVRRGLRRPSGRTFRTASSAS